MSWPKGIWYESARKRYRVRLYKGSETVFLDYFPTLDKAKKALIKARRVQAAALPRRKRTPVDLQTVEAQITGLRNKRPPEKAS